MIITVTLNPSLDRAMGIDALARGDVIRAATTRFDPGGKGVNVSRALLANGVPTRAVLPSGDLDGRSSWRCCGPRASIWSRCRSLGVPDPTPPWPSRTAR